MLGFWKNCGKAYGKRVARQDFAVAAYTGDSEIYRIAVNKARKYETMFLVRVSTMIYEATLALSIFSVIIGCLLLIAEAPDLVDNIALKVIGLVLLIVAAFWFWISKKVMLPDVKEYQKKLRNFTE